MTLTPATVDFAARIGHAGAGLLGGGGDGRGWPACWRWALARGDPPDGGAGWPAVGAAACDSPAVDRGGAARRRLWRLAAIPAAADADGAAWSRRARSMPSTASPSSSPALVTGRWQDRGKERLLLMPGFARHGRRAGSLCASRHRFPPTPGDDRWWRRAAASSTRCSWRCTCARMPVSLRGRAVSHLLPGLRPGQRPGRLGAGLCAAMVGADCPLRRWLWCHACLVWRCRPQRGGRWEALATRPSQADVAWR